MGAFSCSEWPSDSSRSSWGCPGSSCSSPRSIRRPTTEHWRRVLGLAARPARRPQPRRRPARGPPAFGRGLRVQAGARSSLLVVGAGDRARDLRFPRPVSRRRSAASPFELPRAVPLLRRLRPVPPTVFLAFTAIGQEGLGLVRAAAGSSRGFPTSAGRAVARAGQGIDNHNFRATSRRQLGLNTIEAGRSIICASRRWSLNARLHRLAVHFLQPALSSETPSMHRRTSRSPRAQGPAGAG